METLLIVWSVGVVISFMFFVIGIKVMQNEDYDNASHEDKKDILFMRHKEILAILLTFIASCFWFVILPALFLFLGFLQKESD